MKTLFLISSALFITLFLGENSYSQEYVQDIVASQSGNDIIIKYKLQNHNKKGYIDQERRLKGNKFTIKLYYTIDNQHKTEVLDAIGDIGVGIMSGENKTINWNLTNSVYGLIGKVDFSIDAEPVYPKRSFSVTYSTGLVGGESFIDPFDYNSILLKFYKPFKYLNGSLLTSIGLSFYHVADSYKSESSISPLVGVGFQTNNRVFSLYAYLGPNLGSRNFEANEYMPASQNSWFGICARVGFDLKLFDSNSFTILLPVSLAIEPSNDLSMVESGLCLQF